MSDMDRFEGDCEGCGKGMTREVPKTAKGPMADLWRHAAFWCDECLAAEEEERHMRAHMDAWKQRVEASGLPIIHRRTLEELSQPKSVLDSCRAWIEGSFPGLMLTGPVGTGKTTLAGAAVFEMLTARAVLWAPLGTFFARLSMPFGRPEREWANRVVDGNTALALDDLDKARNTEYGREQVFTAVDHRIEHGLPLVITANMDTDEIAQRFGSAVASRITGYCLRVEVNGSDRRLGAV